MTSTFVRGEWQAYPIHLPYSTYVLKSDASLMEALRLRLDLIRQIHDAIGQNLRVDQLHGRTIAIDKQADTFAQYKRMYQHLNLIDQARIEQRMNEFGAADNRDD